MRTFALDVHKNFSEVAVHEGSQVRRVGRVETRDLRAFAAALEPTDHVVLESTSVSWAIVDLLAEHAGKITMSNPMQTKAITQAKVGTDKVDAKVLAKLGAADFVAEVWVPDTETRALRRRVAHRASLVRQRSALRNQVHAILARNLLALEATDLFGKKGRALLGAVELPEHESEQLASALRLHDALQGEVQRLERTLAGHALKRQSVRRLMTIPGVGSITALSIVSVIGEVSRFPSARHLVGYLGLDPKVRQSGERAARTGHISRQGQAHARGLLVEAAHAAVRTPGPLRAFYRRLGARRGQKIALVATARKLAIVCWHMLTREEDYRFEAQALTLRKAGQPPAPGGEEGERITVPGEAKRRALERRLLEQAQRTYEAEVARRGSGAGPQGGRDSSGRRAADDARQAHGPEAPALLDEVTRAEEEPTGCG